MRHRLLSSLPILALVATGCTTDNPGFVDSFGECAVGTSSVREQFAVPAPDKVDVLFVVENAPGMAPFQARLADAMPAFVAALDDRELDWRAGVVSTDMADGAQLQMAATCDVSAAAMVEAGDADAAAILACNVRLGESGSPFTQGLNAAAHAFGDTGTPDFLRDDARLLVVVVAAHDDCSLAEGFDTSTPNNCVWQADGLQTVDGLLSSLVSFPSSSSGPLRGEPVSLVTFSGPEDGIDWASPTEPTASCVSGSSAFAGTRYREASDHAGVVGADYSICEPTYGPALREAIEQTVAMPSNTICMSVPMVGEPSAVRIIDSLGGDAEEVFVLDAGDYLNLGATDTCSNGAVAVSVDAHAHLGVHNVEVFFCRE